MNVVILSGNLCKDNTIRYTESNIAVIQNTIAVKNDFKNKDGEYDSQFINVVAYRNTAEFISKYTQKGSKVLLEGRWNTRNYENEDGKKVYVNEMIVNKVELIGSKKEGTKAETTTKEETKEPDPYKDFGNEVELTEDDLPF